MAGYLGATPVTSLNGTPFEGFGPAEWALDQVARVLLGTKVEVRMARWSDGREEYRFSCGALAPPYLEWVDEMKGETEYDYEEGVAP